MMHIINDALGPDFERQVEALIMAFHQHGEPAGGTSTARLALKATSYSRPFAGVFVGPGAALR